MTHRQLAESGWNPHTKRAAVRLVSHGGRAEAPQTAERLRQWARSRLNTGAPQESVAQDPPWRVLETGPCGALDVREAMWQRLGLPDVLAAPLASRTVDVAVDRARLAMVAKRACAPRSTRAGADQWWREAVRIDGTEALVVHPRDRAMDVLAAHQDAMAPAV